MYISRLSLFAFALLLFSCNRGPKVPENDPAFADFILAHTSGVISKYSEIEVHLSQDLNPGVEPGTQIEAEVFDFSPNIKGQAVWGASNLIRFIPSENLRPGQVYEASFELGAVATVDKSLQTFEFNFQAIEQAYQLLRFKIEPYQRTDLIWNQIEGEITCADRGMEEELRKDLQFGDLDSKKIKWNLGANSLRWEFHIDSLERKEKAYEIPIFYQKEELGQLRVPGLSDFEVIAVYVQQSPQQKVSISFSDPLNERQNTAGMFQLGGKDVKSVEIEGSVVHLYPEKRFSGSVQLTVYPGIKNILGYKFPKEYTTNISFEARKPEIRFVNEGTIVPTQGSVRIPFEAVSLRAVDISIYQIYANNVQQFLQINRLSGSEELRRVASPIHRERINLQTEGRNPLDWNSYAIDLDRIIQREPGAIYRIELSFQKSYSLYPCDGDANTELESLSAPTWEEDEEDQFERYYYEPWYFEGYDYRERDNPCHISYYSRDRKIERNVLASDIGLVVKGGEKEWYTYTQSISTAKGLSGLAIKYFNYQGQLIAEGQSDASGYLKVKLDSRPFLVVAENGAERAYRTLENSSSLSISSFAVGGRDARKGVEGMCYTERGIWRPGDTIFLDFILDDKDNPLPSTHPLVLSLQDPRGQEIYRTVQSRGSNSIFHFPLRTEKDAPTGNYSVHIKVGGKSFYHNLAVESIQPNRLDISLKAEGEIIDASNEGNIDLDLDAEWLTGADAADLQAQVTARISSNPNAFKEKHPLFDFNDESRSAPYVDDPNIFEGKLDASGHADIRKDLGYLRNSPGMLRLHLGTKVFEPGGRFSIKSTTLNLAPYSAFAGIQMPELNNYGYLETGKNHPIGLIRVNQAGKPIAGQLRVTVYKVHWSWWWSAQRGQATYLNNEVSQQLDSKLISVNENGRGRYELNIPDNHWGRLYIVVEDVKSGHRSSALAYVDWAWGRDRTGRAGGESVSVLNVQTDKDSYEVGETAKISVPSAAGGRLILSYENAQGQLSQTILNTQAGSTVHDLEISPDMAPNCYAHAMIVQPHSAKGNDLPLRLYGIIPILVEDPATRLKPILKAPEEIRPNSRYKIAVSEAKGKAMEYTLAVVDEGLLGLNNFQTPEPWSHFYSKTALGLRTWDIYDEVIGGFSGEIAKMLTVGGDAALLQENEEDADRFVPVVRHIGPFKLKAGAEANHELEMPNYLGKVRVMVIAANKDKAYGSADTNISVKQPLMVQMTLPRVLGPEEEVLVPVTVFAMKEGIKEVNLKLSASGKINLLDKEQKISFAKPGQKTVYFKAKVARALGKASLTISASSGAEKSSESIEIAVRSPMRKQQQIFTSVVEGSPVSYRAEPFGISGSNRLVVSLSSLPKLNLAERLDYLIGYPHGCLEQTTSKCFAQLNLEKWVDLKTEEKAAIREFVNAGLNKLRGLQLSEGGFRYWPGNTTPDAWASTYVGHFLLSAEAAGYKLPAGLKEGYLRYARQEARTWANHSSLSSNNDLNQAYRLYVLALAGKPEMGAMTRLRNQGIHSRAAAYRLASAYALLGEKEAARELMQKYAKLETDQQYYYYCYGSSLRDKVMQMESFNELGDRAEAMRLAKEIAEELSEGWHSTQTIAYSLQALGSLFSNANEKIEARITQDGITKNISSNLSVYQWEVKDFAKISELSIESSNGKPLFLTIVREGLPVYGSETAQSNRISMSVRYTDMQGKTIDPSRLKIGTQLIAELSITRSSLSKDFENLAVSQMFPSGWEITNSRVFIASTVNNEGLDYQDIRDDRVLSYYNAYRYSSKIIRVELTASYPGKWYLPPTWIEAMYEGSIAANNKGQWVEVVVN